PLVVALEVRRRVQADAIAARAQYRFQHRARRALSVRAADGDHGTWKRKRKPRRDIAHAVEAQRDRLRVERFEIREPALERGGPGQVEITARHVRHFQTSMVAETRSPSRSIARS